LPGRSIRFSTPARISSAGQYFANTLPNESAPSWSARNSPPKTTSRMPENGMRGPAAMDSSVRGGRTSHVARVSRSDRPGHAKPRALRAPGAGTIRRVRASLHLDGHLGHDDLLGGRPALRTIGLDR